MTEDMYLSMINGAKKTLINLTLYVDLAMVYTHFLTLSV
jgi:hypothetical protein